MANKMDAYGIFSGGGVKAAAFVGAIKEALNHVNFIGVGGTSAGSIVASLIACGYTISDIENLLFEMPYSCIFKMRKIRFLLSHKNGLCNDKVLLDWIRNAISKKLSSNGKKISFLKLQEFSKCKLKIIATNLSEKEIKVYSATDTPNDEVALAILASCSFPFIFPAVEHGGDLVVDGGIMSNFPMWMFDDERKKNNNNKVLGFSLNDNSSNIPSLNLFPSYLYSIFDSILVAQDKVQERYLDVGRYADVIRISIPKTATFDGCMGKEERESLMAAGQRAAFEYFKNAPSANQEHIPVSSVLDLNNISKHIKNNQHALALSSIARHHILKGGVATDQGIGSQRIFVEYYIDLMGAVTHRDKLDLLVSILESVLPTGYDRIIGIQKGNVLLAAHVAYKNSQQFSVFKADHSFKMGIPFDGIVNKNERVIIIDDIASDASMILNTIGHLGLLQVQVLNVITLIERTEGDARKELAKANCQLISVCKACDNDIRNLLESEITLPK